MNCRAVGFDLRWPDRQGRRPLFADFPKKNEYAELNDDELLQLASDRQSLTDEAKAALDAEMRNRDLTLADLAKHQTFIQKSEQRERRRRNRRLFGSRHGLLAWVRFALFWLLVMLATALVATWLARRSFLQDRIPWSRT